MYLLALVGLPSSSRGMTATSIVSMASLLPSSLDFSLDPCLREKEKVKLEGNRLVPEEPPWLLTSRKRTRREGMHAAIKQATDSVWSQMKRITSSSRVGLVSHHNYSFPSSSVHLQISPFPRWGSSWHLTIPKAPALWDTRGQGLEKEGKAGGTHTTPMLIAIKIPNFSFFLSMIPHRKVHGRKARKKSRNAE